MKITKRVKIQQYGKRGNIGNLQPLKGLSSTLAMPRVREERGGLCRGPGHFLPTTAPCSPGRELPRAERAGTGAQPQRSPSPIEPHRSQRGSAALSMARTTPSSSSSCLHISPGCLHPCSCNARPGAP